MPLLSLAFLVLVTTTAAPVPAPAWGEPLPDLEYRRFVHRAPASSGDVTIHALRFSPRSFELRVLPAAATKRGELVPALGRAAAALVAVNGGYFTADFAPLGLLVSEGRELNPLRAADWGVFYVAGERARVVHRKTWKKPKALEFAVEAGPRLIVAGRTLTFKPQSARRTALGILPDGRVVIVVTEQPLLTAELADWMARSEGKGGLGCRDALNLDGGTSTQLWFPAGDETIEVKSRAPVANAVGPKRVIVTPERVPRGRCPGPPRTCGGAAPRPGRRAHGRGRPARRRGATASGGGCAGRGKAATSRCLPAFPS